MEAFLIINLMSSLRAPCHAALRTRLIIFSHLFSLFLAHVSFSFFSLGLFPSLCLSILLQLWQNAARATMKQLQAAACLFNTIYSDVVIHESLPFIIPHYYSDPWHSTLLIRNLLPTWPLGQLPPTTRTPLFCLPWGSNPLLLSQVPKRL